MHFDIAICLRIAEDHMDRYDNMNQYVNAKARIFRTQNKDDVAIIAGCAYTKNMHYLSHQTMININEEINKKNDIDIPIDIIKKFHHKENIYTAIFAVKSALNKIGKIFNIEEFYLACASFAMLPHRVEHVLKKYDLDFVNDSKATNIDSSIAALRSFSNIQWIAGGICKETEASIEKIKDVVHNISCAYLIGKSAEKFAKIMHKLGVQYSISETLENALREIYKKQIKHGTVLLSPGCSSFDQWNNFKERGNVFKDLVMQIWKK